MNIPDQQHFEKFVHKNSTLAMDITLALKDLLGNQMGIKTRTVKVLETVGIMQVLGHPL